MRKSTDIGKPRVDWPRYYGNIYFSNSHAPGLVVIAISRILEIGIDVETLHRDVEIDEIAKLVLAEAEAYELARRAPRWREIASFHFGRSRKHI